MANIAQSADLADTQNPESTLSSADRGRTHVEQVSEHPL